MVRRFELDDLNSQEFPAVRKDTPAALSTNNHYHPLLIDENGRLYVNIGTGTVAVSGALTDAQLRASAVPTSDSGPAQELTRTHTQNNDISTARDITVAPDAGKKIKATDILVSVDTDCYVTIQIADTAEVISGAYMTARVPFPFTLRGMLKSPTADKKLQVKSDVASKADVTAIYFSEA